MTFSDYFRSTRPVDQLVQDFGYRFQRAKLDWPENPAIQASERFLERLQRVLNQADLLTEIARREFLIAPVFAELLMERDFRIRPEYPVETESGLQGSIDYLIEGEHHLVVVEAKNADLERCVIQLAVELIAVAELNPGEAEIHGIATTGDTWRFCRLSQSAKMITQDTSLLTLPDDASQILSNIASLL